MIRIVRVVSVTDTRQYEEGPDERWHPIPGSGLVRECDRCGRNHEVHAEVELSDGMGAIVGTGCASSESLEVASLLKDLGSKAKRLKRFEAELAGQHTSVSSYVRAREQVERMVVPEPVYSVREMATGTVPVVSIGDATMWLTFGSDTNPRERARRTDEAVMAWKANRLAELGFRVPARVDSALERKVAVLRRELGQG